MEDLVIPSLEDSDRINIHLSYDETRAFDRRVHMVTPGIYDGGTYVSQGTLDKLQRWITAAWVKTACDRMNLHHEWPEPEEGTYGTFGFRDTKGLGYQERWYTRTEAVEPKSLRYTEWADGTMTIG